MGGLFDWSSLTRVIFQMSSLTDFDYQPHRTVSAAVAFQKGLYHLFLLHNDQRTDIYELLIRTYQCVFQLCVTLLLLDETFSLTDLLNTPAARGLAKKVCADPKKPGRNEIDPACVLTHSAIQKWSGFTSTHPLVQSGVKARELLSRTVDARHNLLYRPFLLDRTDPGFDFGPFWEDCTLKALIGGAPKRQEVEVGYGDFASAIWDWRKSDRASKIPSGFIFSLFDPYVDTANQQPTETAVLRYARMLAGDNETLLAQLAGYRNKLIDPNRHAKQCGIGFPPEWKVGEI